jgi:hypothetical protein
VGEELPNVSTNLLQGYEKRERDIVSRVASRLIRLTFPQMVWATSCKIHALCLGGISISSRHNCEMTNVL